MNSPRIETPPSGEDGGGVSATSETLCEAVHIIERGMAGPLLACRRRRARTFKEEVACGKIKVPTEREFFVRRYSLMRHLAEAVMPQLSPHCLIRRQRSSTPIVGSYQASR